MKKLKFLIGFPIGVTMLLISYILVNIIDGQAEYMMELTRLADVNVLINQVAVSGLFYTLYGMWIQSIFTLYTNREKNFQGKDLAKFLVNMLVVIVASYLIDKYASFGGEEVVNTLLGIGIVLLAIVVLGHIFVTIITEHIINKKIKARNENKK